MTVFFHFRKICKHHCVLQSSTLFVWRYWGYELLLLCSSFSQFFRKQSRASRSSNQFLLEVPGSGCKRWGGRAFSVAALGLWNKLPPDTDTDPGLFKSRLKTCLLRTPFNTWQSCDILLLLLDFTVKRFGHRGVVLNHWLVEFLFSRTHLHAVVSPDNLYWLICFDAQVCLTELSHRPLMTAFVAFSTQPWRQTEQKSNRVNKDALCWSSLTFQIGGTWDDPATCYQWNFQTSF